MSQSANCTHIRHFSRVVLFAGTSRPLTTYSNARWKRQLIISLNSSNEMPLVFETLKTSKQFFALNIKRTKCVLSDLNFFPLQLTRAVTFRKKKCTILVRCYVFYCLNFASKKVTLKVILFFSWLLNTIQLKYLFNFVESRLWRSYTNVHQFRIK